MAGWVVEDLQVVKKDEVLNCLVVLYMSCMKLCALKHKGNSVFKKLQNVQLEYTPFYVISRWLLIQEGRSGLCFICLHACVAVGHLHSNVQTLPTRWSAVISFVVILFTEYS